MGDWKLVLNGSLSEIGGSAEETAGAATKADKQGKKAKQPKNAGKSTATAAEELFNLAQDPYEKTTLAAKNPEKLQELRARLDAFATEAVPPKLAPRAAGFTSPKVWGEFP